MFRVPAWGARTAAVVLLAAGSCRCGSTAPTRVQAPPTPQAAVDPALPGIQSVSELLQNELLQALQSKGADYRPRTEHLNGDGSPKYINRLILQTSPYLLQHAHNPVNWFSWGEEAFERARATNRPILLSVGYSTCHWCHVMERESFEDEEIAQYINEYFIPIKVDREERADVDELYMQAVHLLAGRGGWPMTVVLTPDGDPFFAGTYFPPRDGARGARKGFATILRELVERYQTEGATVVADAQRISQRIQELSAPKPPTSVPPEATIATTARTLLARFDATHGGFGHAPKFPQPSQLELLMRVARRNGDVEARRAVELTLEKMAHGGIYDQVGGGFHRYSTDARWLVPHFEKMLYDNAQLVPVYLRGYRLTGREDFARVARDALDYVSREMRSADGLFYSATDADSPVRPNSLEMEEGLFFTWTPQELQSLLQPELAALVSDYWGVTPRGNFEGRTILHLSQGLEEFARERNQPVDAIREQIRAAKQTLYAARAQRPPPLRDDKVLAAWNGLMLSAFAQAAWEFDDTNYRQVATEAARALVEHLRLSDGRLARSFINGRASHRAYVQDYAFLIAGLIDTFEATFDPRWIREAVRLQAELDAHYSESGGGYWMTADDAEELLARDKPGYDGAVPSGNAVEAMNLLRLSAFRTDNELRQRAEGIFASFGTQLRQRGAGMTRMLSALDAYYDRQLEVVIVYRDESAKTALAEVLRNRYLPNHVHCLVDEARGNAWLGAMEEAVPVVESKRVIGTAGATAYVCEHGRCQLPTSNPRLLGQQLAELSSQ